MAKRSSKQSMDIVTEVQQNSRWFGGGRKYAFPMDRTKAEWFRQMRSLFPHGKLLLLYLLMMGGSAILGVLAFINYGVSVETIGGFVFTVFLCVWAILSLRRLFRKD